MDQVFRTIGFLFVLLSLVPARGQNYGKGLAFNDINYELSPLKPDLIEAEYATLLNRFSLKAFCPLPGNQLQMNTSVGWATGYGARSILQAISNEWSDPKVIGRNAFSPHLHIHSGKEPCRPRLHR